MYYIRTWFEGTYTLRIAEDFLDLFVKIFPYLVASILLNALVARFVQTKKLFLTSKSELISIASSAIIGIVSPLPTYAAIPIGLSMMPLGIPFSAVIAFILSSPLMNPTIFFLTATRIGIGMAVARAISAFLVAVAGGLLASKVFTSLYVPKDVQKVEQADHPRPLWTDLWRNARYVGKYFCISMLLSAAVKALIPPETIAHLLGGNTKVSTLVAIGMGVPFYTCGGSAIPFMETLMDLGMSKGAMLAFFIAGPATKLETLYAYKTMLGGKVLLFYLALTLSFAYVAGMISSLLF